MAHLSSCEPAGSPYHAARFTNALALVVTSGRRLNQLYGLVKQVDIVGVERAKVIPLHGALWILVLRSATGK